MIGAMRKIWVMVVNQLHRMVAEGQPVWLVPLPMVLMFVLGITLQGVFAEDFTPAEPYRIALVAEEQGPASLAAGARRGLPQFFTLAFEEDPAEARQLVLRQERDAAVLVPEGFPHEPITIIAPPGSVVSGILTEVLRAAAEQPGALDGGGDQVALAVTQVAVEADGNGSGHSPPAWAGVGSFQYYGIALTVMFAMFAAHVAMTYCAGDRTSGAYARVRSMGVSRPAYLVGGFASAVLMAVGLIAFMRVATSLVYGVSWGEWTAWAVLTLFGAAGVAGISFLVMSVAPQNPKAVDEAGGVLFTILAILGGSTWPVPTMPEPFAEALAWLPNRVVLDGYFKVAGGGGLAAVTGELRLLGLATLALFVAAWVISSLRARGEA